MWTLGPADTRYSLAGIAASTLCTESLAMKSSSEAHGKSLEHKKLRNFLETTGNDPYSPECIYTNLIITEHALRSQYIDLHRGRRSGLIFFSIVIAGSVYFTYRAVYAPVSNSTLQFLIQLMAFASYISIGLFFLTGKYTNTFFTSRVFISDTNKGLRPLHVKIVRTSTGIKVKLARIFYDPCYSNDPAGVVKLVLSPQEFNKAFIDKWELFRNDYWERQHRLKKKMKMHKNKAKKRQ